jgi:outer membrane protein assembly factor BamB
MTAEPKTIRACAFAFFSALGAFAGEPAPDELPPLELRATDWPCWRGPTRDNQATGAAPIRWSRTENIVWSADVPGRGHASPCVSGDRVFLATCDEIAEKQLVLGYDRKTGKLLWTTVAHEGGLEHRHEKNSHASATPACDGERVFVPFLNRGAIRVTATDLDGKILWQKDAGAFETMHGYSSSPVLWKSFVIIDADSSAGSFLAALHRKSGEIVWKTPRRNIHSFATPALATVSGKPQLVLNAAQTVSSYDPDTGKPIWYCEGPAQFQACTPALGPDFVFASGGYPEKEILCLRADGQGNVTATHILWRSKHGVTYVPSPIYHDGRVLVVNGGGVVTCFDGKAGTELWKDRLPGEFSASPVLAGGVFYDTNEDGVTHVFRAGDKLEVLASNDLGDGGFASPAICGGQIFIRASHRLVCIGDAAPKWLHATAYAIPKHTTSEGSGYFSIIEGRNRRLYIGTAKYRENAYLVEFDLATKEMRVAVDTMQEIRRTFPDRPDGSATGFAAQAKIHTRNNIGESGKIYFATKQGYPNDKEKRDEYRGGYPMVYDPATQTTRVYDIPVAHQGIISIAPDESRGLAYISTCSDERPLESSHFLLLDLATGAYRDLIDCRHMYGFIVIDAIGRAWHPILGGSLARFDPRSGLLDKLAQTIDGAPPKPESHLADPESHPINWDITPDRRTLHALAMNGNELYSYDLAAEGDTVPGRALGKLIAGTQSVDCRAMCVGPTGEVWAAVTAKIDGEADVLLHVVSYRPGDAAPRDHGRVDISNRSYTELTDAEGKPLPYHHGIRTLGDGTMVPLYPMGICQARDGTVYVTVIDPYTVLEIRP